jgi:DNA-binding transcriptional MerR regulator
MATALLIGDLAARTGVAAPTIRYYESIGLLMRAARSEAGYRRYSEQTVRELAFIRKAQAMGFSLDEIAEILRLSRSGKAPCAHVLSLTEQHVAAVEERIRQLEQFRDQLRGEVAKWKGRPVQECGGLCRIISTAETTAPSALDLTSHRRMRARKAPR